MKSESETDILQLFRWNSCNETPQRNTFLGRTIFSVRQKGVPPLLLPASVLQLPRCLARIYNLTSYDTTLFELDSFKKCNCNRKNRLQIQFASQMWATRPHLGSIFEKLLHRKTFQLPAARILQPTSHLFISPAFPCFCETVNNIVHYPILYAV